MKIRIDPLDKLFSEYIRKRAIKRVHGCERCKSYCWEYKRLQCSHYHKRRKRATRWDEDNCVGICFGCHQYFEENRDEYTEWMKHYLGEDRFDMLNSRVRITYPGPDKALIELYLKQKIKELDNGH